MTQKKKEKVLDLIISDTSYLLALLHSRTDHLNQFRISTTFPILPDIYGEWLGNFLRCFPIHKKKKKTVNAAPCDTLSWIGFWFVLFLLLLFFYFLSISFFFSFSFFFIIWRLLLSNYPSHWTSANLLITLVSWTQVRVPAAFKVIQ